MAPTLSLCGATPLASPAVVDLLTTLLERAKAGEILDMAYVIALRGRNVQCGVSTGSEYHLINSGAARLAAKLAAMDD